jgi:tetratricopeptide (TPR) repeat protein
MFLKTFITTLFLFSFVFTLVSYLPEQVQAGADEPMFNETECKRRAIDIIPDECLKKGPANKELAKEHLRELEKEMELNVDNALFPKLFSKYLGVCMRLKEQKRAIDFFLTLTGENPTSSHALTAKGIITYGWWAEKILRGGLKKIDEAISLDTNAFFPRLCRATYLSYLPEEFMAAINEFNVLLETERDNPSNLYDVYSNLVRIYGEHGHYDMAAHINEKLLEVQSRINKKVDYPHKNERSLGNGKYYNEIIQFPYPIMNNTITNKATSTKDRQLNRHLAILERNMERKLNDTIFGDIYTRYILLTWQYGEINRAINFFEGLAKRYPQSPNVLAALGTITYGWRGQILLQKGLDCIEGAIEIDNDNFFSRINHATFIAYFPNGFMKSMYEFSLLRQIEKDSPKSLNIINYRINFICSQHGHGWDPAERHEEPVIKYAL